MAVKHHLAHEVDKSIDPQIHGPYLDDIRAAEDQNRREARQRARKANEVTVEIEEEVTEDDGAAVDGEDSEDA